MKKYVVLEKAVGQTPLECMEAWRTAQLQQPPSSRKDLELGVNTPLTYAGRLDPMASGKLLILIGAECKEKERYTALDKEYRFSVLFGIGSDSGDVLGIPTINPNHVTKPSSRKDLELTLSTLKKICTEFIGDIELPYPHYSAKTVRGKPLHTWTLEGRLHEISIPTKVSTIFKLTPTAVRTLTMNEVLDYVGQKIEMITLVTDTRKSLGNDFRRSEIRPAWQAVADQHSQTSFYVADFVCSASSGTYMRTLAKEIAQGVGTIGLAWHIHRTTLGSYTKLPIVGGYWRQRFN